MSIRALSRVAGPITLLTMTLGAVSCGGAADLEGASQALVGWWRFEEGSGTRVADASGLGNHAELVGGEWSPGVHGAALAMDGGNDDIVVVPLTDSLRATDGAITVMGWARRTARHNVALVSQRYPDLFLGFHGMRFKWELQNSRGGRAACYADPEYRAELGRWYHLAASHDGWRARLYVDGREICSRWLFGSRALPEAPFTLSGYLDASGAIVDEITGTIDEVRIYDQALSARTIRALMQRDMKE